MKNLIIVESPTKAKTISNFLGDDFEVVASKGHIRDLPKSSFGIKIEDDKFTPKYSIPRDVNPIVKRLRELAKSAKEVYIATDEDREGEAIGYHIAIAIKKDPKELPRIVFHEITKNAISKALQNPRKIDMNSVNAQQARRLLDRIVGYKLSPLLQNKIQKGLSAGRVQSATLKIIVDREREILAFVPQEYWTIEALFERVIEASIFEFDGERLEKLSIKDKQMADEIVSVAKSEEFIVDSIDIKHRTTKSPPPFMTSTLQQSASSKLGFSPKKTMIIAQKLYEGVETDKGNMGVITYMRTDSLNISKEAIADAREYISKNFPKEYLPKEPKHYTTKSKTAQEAHEAIRPTMVEFDLEIAKRYLSRDEFRLYELIYNRFLASQMSDAKFETQSVVFRGQRSKFRATGKRLVFDGFYKVLGYDEKDRLLPNLELNKRVSLDKIEAKQHHTEPPPRYTEATLIKKLETLGIGRPSTYAPTITTLQDRKYIEIKQKKIHPTKIAFTVTEVLEEHFSDIVDSSFTSNMEEKLDKIGEGLLDWQRVLYEFYKPFIEKIERGKSNIKSQKIAIPIGKECPKCGGELVRRKGKFGEFIACGNFPKCKYTTDLDGNPPKEPQKTDIKCDKCGEPMVVKESKRGKFLACSAYPKCKNTKPITPPKELKIPCPNCGSKLIERVGKRGKFYGCLSYPKCRFIVNGEPQDWPCPDCGGMVVHKKLKSGEFYSCINKECKFKQKIEKAS